LILLRKKERKKVKLAAMSSSYEKVKGGKLSLKGGPGLEKAIDKKKKKKNHKKKAQLGTEEGEATDPVAEVEVVGEESGKKSGKPVYDIDTGTGHAPDGKKSKKYEELFPVETKRFGYVIPEVLSREAALDERVKKKADRYCK
jgi:hypothetical protein